MDIVLEVFDTLVFDRVYSTLIPASTPSSFLEAGKTNASSTFSSLHNNQPQHKWLYQPASQIISLQPTAWAYSSAWPRDNILRQTTSLFLITWLFGLFVYFVCASLSYIFIYDKTAMKHPKFLKNQISLEMRQANTAMPIMALLTAPFFVAEVRGHANLYDTFSQAPFPAYNYLQFPFFILFTDFFIYWIHRGLHHRLVYKTLHKPHHRWIVPTPYASHAFHPLDGFAQSLPYHVFPFIFPLQKLAYVALFAFINVWTIMIHDGEYVADSPIINGAACHTLHHLYFSVVKLWTIYDAVGSARGSYRKPNPELFIRDTKMGKKEWDKQTKEMEGIVKEVEGEDDRKYGEDELKKTM